MPIKLITCYVAECDECHNVYEGEDFTPHHDSANDAMSAAESLDWAKLGDGTVLCGHCIDSLVKQGVIEENESDDPEAPPFCRTDVPAEAAR